VTDHSPDTDDRNALAGELALRVLSPAEEAEARGLATSDPAFAAQVDGWNEHLAGLADEIAPVEPSPSVWARIQAAIMEVANDNARLLFWKRWAIGSTGLLAASLAAVVVMLARPEPVPVPIEPTAPLAVTRVATITAEGGPPVVMLAYDSATGKLFVSPTQQMAGESGEGQVPHLWLVLPDEAGVRLIGAIDGTHAATHNLNAALSGLANQAPAVAISMEPAGHTPGLDKPDGPVVASGELKLL